MKGKGNLPEAWFTKAEADLKAAELLLDAEEPLVDIACYHAQQCAEKCLKGYLVECRIPFKFVHELTYLLRLCINQNADFSDLLDPAVELQDYAASVRYPDDDVEPLTFEESQRAIECAKRIREFIREVREA